MIFHPTPLGGVYWIEAERLHDARGYFARSYDKLEFDRQKLCTEFAQCSVSFNLLKGTVRGMHFQTEPHAEVKLIRCTRGAVWDVVIDLRPESVTYCKWFGAELTADNLRMMYVPEGCAHGFQTLGDNAELFYQISITYSPTHASGVRWNDSRFSINWPLPMAVISERDAEWPDFGL